MDAGNSVVKAGEGEWVEEGKRGIIGGICNNVNNKNK